MILRKFTTMTVAGIVFAGMANTYAVDSLPGVELWLPKSYQSHYVTLVEVAKKIQREPECWQLLNGRLHESKSTIDAPVFYFRCRDEARKSYSYEVDVNTLTITDSRIARKQLLQQKKAREEEQAKEKQREAEKSHWEACYKAIQDKISSFNEAKITSELPPKGNILDSDTMQFKVNVDGLSLAQKPLRYTARCNIRNPEDIDVKIKRRKN